ncbi:MAG: hypothetical protein COB53_01235 [Elusimicrobia bacterium]|nr:MAG: hypothetical protein COB53_01235 [Elusimicrobiota bacterium]
MTPKNPRSINKNFLTALAAISSVGILLFLFSAPTTGGPLVGSRAPDFSLTDLGGRTTHLSKLRGKIVLLDFWATWCVSCADEVPELKALYSEYKGQGLSLLAISVDEGGPEIVARFAAEFELPYPVLFIDDDTMDNYRIFGLPTKFLIDEDGKVFRKYMVNTTRQEIAADITTLLERRSS